MKLHMKVSDEACKIKDAYIYILYAIHIAQYNYNNE